MLRKWEPQIKDPGDPSERNDAATLDFARFKREVYHKVLELIFTSCHSRSYFGEALRCGDNFKRVLYPGVPILSLDGEEACSACGCRAFLANYPCPRCLVHKDQLHMITARFTPRTTETMQDVYNEAVLASSKTHREDLLKGNGLHFTKVY